MRAIARTFIDIPRIAAGSCDPGAARRARLCDSIAATHVRLLTDPVQLAMRIVTAGVR
ncbi:hypothetical protein XAP6164_4680010 [Xanthomonas phaseoli pv. phaseoli]|nr:hypothetical protein XAP6164_4680010 [Xanthomonas phaseoli pv. phaseoli]